MLGKYSVGSGQTVVTEGTEQKANEKEHSDEENKEPTSPKDIPVK